MFNNHQLFRVLAEPNFRIQFLFAEDGQRMTRPRLASNFSFKSKYEQFPSLAQHYHISFALGALYLFLSDLRFSFKH